MCKSSSHSTSTSSPPPQFLSAYSNLVNAGANLAEQPLQQYTGPLQAGFAPQQLNAFQTIQDAQGIAAPFINTAAQYASAGATPVTPTSFSASQVGQYMSPYIQNVVNATQAQFANQNAQQQNQLRGNEIAAGAWGGDRSAIQEGILANQQDLAQAPTIANLYNTGYGQALGEFNTQQQTGMAAQEASNSAALNAAFTYGLLGPSALNTTLTGAGANLNAGNLQQQQAQQALNIPYEQFIAQQAYPYQNLNFLAGLTEGAGSLSGGSSSTTQTQPMQLFRRGGRPRHFDYGGIASGVPDLSMGYVPQPYGAPTHSTIPGAPSAGGGGKGGGGGGDGGGGMLSGAANAAKSLDTLSNSSSLAGMGDALASAGQEIGSFLLPFIFVKDGGHVPHLATGGAPVNYIPGSRGIPTPQIDTSIYAPQTAIQPGTMGNWFNPIPQYQPTSAPRVTPMPANVLAGLNAPATPTGNRKLPAQPAPWLSSGPLSGSSFTDGMTLPRSGIGFDSPINLQFAKGGKVRLEEGGDAGVAMDPSQENAAIGAGITAGRKGDGAIVPSDGPRGWESGAMPNDGNVVWKQADPRWWEVALSGVAGALQHRSLGAGLAGAWNEYERELDEKPTVDHSGRTILITSPGESGKMQTLDTGIPTEAALNAQMMNDYRMGSLDERTQAATQAATDREQRLADTEKQNAILDSLRAQGQQDPAQYRAAMLQLERDKEADLQASREGRGSVTWGQAQDAAEKDYDRMFPKPQDPNAVRPVPPEGMGSWLNNRRNYYLNGARNAPPQVQPSPQGGAPQAPQGPQPPPGFKQASDHKFYAPDPKRPGKYLQWTP